MIDAAVCHRNRGVDDLRCHGVRVHVGFRDLDGRLVCDGVGERDARHEQRVRRRNIDACLVGKGKSLFSRSTSHSGAVPKMSRN